MTRSGQVWLFAKAAVLLGTGVALLFTSAAILGVVVIVIAVVGYVVFRAWIK